MKIKDIGADGRLSCIPEEIRIQWQSFIIVLKILTKSTNIFSE